MPTEEATMTYRYGHMRPNRFALYIKGSNGYTYTVVFLITMHRDQYSELERARKYSGVPLSRILFIRNTMSF